MCLSSTVIHPSASDVTGGSIVETNQLISSILEDGSGEVLALPDGPVCGRWDLQGLASKAGEVRMMLVIIRDMKSALSVLAGIDRTR